MVRIQIDLTEEQIFALSDIVAITVNSQCELMRESIGIFVGRCSKERRKAILANAAGMWKDRDDLPAFDVMRNEWNRGVQP